MASSSGKTAQPSGACNGTAADLPNIEQELYDYQMHTKMCKKIAQLTKVIYSLNMKYEEQETALQSLREAHEEELRKMAEEAQGKLVPSKVRPEEELELHRRLQALEDSLEEQLRLKAEILDNFDSFRQQVEQKDLRTETEHAERLAAVSREALDMRKELEGRVQSLNRLKEQLEDEKEHILAELELARQESRGLREECRELQQTILDEREHSEEVCRARTCTLQEELAALREEKQTVEEQCQRTVSELKEAQQEEQEALRRTLQQSLSEKLAQWQQRELEQRNTLQAALQQKLKKTEEELEIKGQRLSESRRHALKLQERTKDIEGQLEEARRRVSEAEASTRKAEEELAVAKERLLLQENELQCKSEELMIQCSSQSKANAEAEELRALVCRLQGRIADLEQQSSGKTSDHVRQAKQHAEALAAQRQELQRAHAEELRRVRQQMDEERARLREQLRKGLEELMKKQAAELRSAQASVDVERKKAQKELQVQAEEFRRRSEEERRELEREKEVLCARLQESVCEISRLEAIIEQGARASEPASEVAPPCGERCSGLRADLERARQIAAEIKEEHELLKAKHQAEVSALQKEKDAAEERILKQAERHQDEKIRAACESLKKDLTEQHLLAVSRLEREKDEEAEQMSESWREKVKELRTQLEEAKIGSAAETRERGELHLSDDRGGLKCQENMKISYSLKMQQLPSIPEKGQVAEGQDFKELEEALRAERHAHQLALRTLEERLQGELQAERHRQQAQQKLLLDRQKAELAQQHADWSRQVTQRHMQQMEDLQAELRTHTELVALQQDFKQQNQVQAFERQLDECHSEVLDLRRENSELKEQLATLRSQVDSKTQELNQLQGTEQHQKRSWEEEVVSRQHMEVECLKREHRKEIQTIVSDFSSAQTRMQARIVALETELREKDEKSKRRESRIEDLHVIGKLQEKLNEREQVIKRLLEERQHLQHMTSDNAAVKAYENRPQPGSLTPTMRKKKLEEMPPRVTSVPNLSSYEKSFLGPEAAAGVRSPQAMKSPSFEHARSISRTSTPTAQGPELRQGPRYNRSPSEEVQQNFDSYTQPSRTSFEQRHPEPMTEAQELQRQEWFTKYFSF
ncbi:protein FAM184B isoform X1 [Scleropages formosus]|uniref:protein FAM184B isoform X1 n=1 Tax=Scleropages formosus TaxID=113540 RepID=UPI0010FA920F|nr:protein FAM184B isoform X1 [Scleropages formosus]